MERWLLDGMGTRSWQRVLDGGPTGDIALGLFASMLRGDFTLGEPKPEWLEETK